jgi:hypothetical protein
MTKRRAGQILLVVGFVCLVVGAFAGAQYRAATVRKVFFVDPFGLAAGEDGRIYVGIDRREVHAYDAEGRPVAAWTVDADAGRFRLRVVDEGRIEVARREPGELLVYRPDGTRVSREPDAGAFERFGADTDRRVTTPAGAIYELTEDGLVRTRPPPREVVVPAPPAPLSWLGSRPVKLLTALLAAGTFGLIGGAVLTAAPVSGRDAPA